MNKNSAIILTIVTIFILIIWSESITYKKKIETSYNDGYKDGYNAAIEEYGIEP